MPTHLRLASPARRQSLPIRVVFAIDHGSLCRSLRALLDGESDVEVIAMLRDLEGAVRAVRAQLPHVIVVDVGIARGGVAEAIARLRLGVPETEVVVLTMEDSPLAAQRVIDAGAIGFVLKDRADSELPPAIRHAARGDEFVSPHVAGGLDALRSAAVGSDRLSARETEIVRLIALGHTSAEIAGMLHLSRRTIETQRSLIYKKLGIDTRAQLVQFALRRRLMGI
jgi:DNA-binding NarL/FixJ family response regulator